MLKLLTENRNRLSYIPTFYTKVLKGNSLVGNPLKDLVPFTKLFLSSYVCTFSLLVLTALLPTRGQCCYFPSSFHFPSYVAIPAQLLQILPAAVADLNKNAFLFFVSGRKKMVVFAPNKRILNLPLAVHLKLLLMSNYILCHYH